MTERLKLSTKKSLHAPIEIEVDGQVYSRPVITISLLQQVDKLEKKVKTGDFNALVEQIHLLTGVPKSVAKEVDLLDLNSLMDYVSAKLYGSIAGEDEEKKVSKPEPSESS